MFQKFALFRKWPKTENCLTNSYTDLLTTGRMLYLAAMVNIESIQTQKLYFKLKQET